MSYLVRADVEIDIPPSYITEALDDDGDGIEDFELWDKLAARVDNEIDGQLARRYTLPLSDPPATLRSGAATLASETLYKRRAIPAEANPFTKAAADFRSWLADIAAGKAQLAVATPQAKPPISIITEPAGTVPRHRLNG